MKIKYILGTVTVLTIVGGTIYAIKKSKDLERTEGEAISLEEAKSIVKEREIYDRQSERIRTSYSTPFVDDEIVSKPIIGVKKLDIDNVLDDYAEYEEDYEDEEEETVLDHIDIDILLQETITEEDKTLRYEPSSRDARNQYIRMELAEWSPSEETYAIMLKLFDFPFQPQNDGDDFLRTNIIDYRVQFFGWGSKWAKEVSYADVILHYAKAAQYNCDESVKYWLEYFLEFNDIQFGYSSQTIDEVLKSLNAHTYFNEERQTFGLFGLTRQSMDNAFKIANRNIDRSVTYEIEFNEFLKSCL
jgi:hypothetical protein